MGIPLESYTIRDLRNRTGDIVRGAEKGELSVVTKHGQPVFLALPFDEALLRSGVQRSLAAHLFSQGHMTIVQAVKLAGISTSEMLDELASRNIPAVDCSEGELKDELDAFE